MKPLSSFFFFFASPNTSVLKGVRYLKYAPLFQERLIECHRKVLEVMDRIFPLDFFNGA